MVHLHADVTTGSDAAYIATHETATSVLTLNGGKLEDPA
jgi:hypothetical protein